MDRKQICYNMQMIWLHSSPILNRLRHSLTCFTRLAGIASGLSINWSKTEGMWIGSTRSNKAKPLGISWPNEAIKALGIFYTYDQKLLHEKNVLENLGKIKKTVIECLAFSRFIFV